MHTSLQLQAAARPRCVTDGSPAPSDAPEPIALHITLQPGEVLHDAGSFTAHAWSVLQGALRLDLVGPSQPQFVQLALAGDLLGIERWCGLATMHRASAITRCLLQRRTIAVRTSTYDLLATALLQQANRTADLGALRSGPVARRLATLLSMLAVADESDGNGMASVALPRLKDIAAIVDTAPETACRQLNLWRQQARLVDAGPGVVRFAGGPPSACGSIPNASAG